MSSSNIQYGGKGLYGASVGILMLEARFPRLPGDMGNATSWPFPVHYKIVRGASPDKVVRRRAEGLLVPFIEAAKELVADGVDGVTTNCGFLSLFQAELSAAVGVPVATSSLMQVNMVQALLPQDQKVGIVTISKESLTAAHLKAANVPADIPVIGTEGGREFSRVILENEDRMDVGKARDDMLDAGRMLLSEHPTVGAIVLECTNMVPFARDMRKELGVPVFSIHSFIQWFQSGLTPVGFVPDLVDSRRS